MWGRGFWAVWNKTLILLIEADRTQHGAVVVPFGTWPGASAKSVCLCADVPGHVLDRQLVKYGGSTRRTAGQYRMQYASSTESLDVHRSDS